MIARGLGDAVGYSPIVIGPQQAIPYKVEAPINPAVISSTTPRYATPGVPVPVIGSGQGQCPLVNGMPDPTVRECDAYTGVLHYQNALPSGIPNNANINTYDPTRNQFLHSDAAGVVSTTPVVPVYNTKVSVTAPPVNSPVTAITPVASTAPTNTTANTVNPSAGSNNAGSNQQQSLWQRIEAMLGLSSSTPSLVVQPTPNGTPANTGSNSSFWDSLTNLVHGPSITPNSDPIQYQTNAPYVNSFFSWLEQTVPIGNYDIPVWAVGLAGIGGIYIFAKTRHKEGRK